MTLSIARHVRQETVESNINQRLKNSKLTQMSRVCHYNEEDRFIETIRSHLLTS